MKAATPRQRLHKIANAHCADEMGTCCTCGCWWPCFTYTWATDRHLMPDDPFRLIPAKDDHDAAHPSPTPGLDRQGSRFGEEH